MLTILAQENTQRRPVCNIIYILSNRKISSTCSSSSSRFLLLLQLPDLFLLSSMPHYETSPLIGQREPYHLRQARRHHSGLIYDCMDQIIKSPAEHRQRLAAHLQLPVHTGVSKSESP
ncbi:hypothetical protein Q8A67_019961 [Cirrhinus molitorella]|uniref:Uncharacterized protein n=1 Tax=Cirrhinus molitorella TaxID=172907 RepID=A0AA88PFD5_9TELE|nr:hypothetical protein Q8A67_019961 [Cirrhinus molitorella]